MPKHFQFSFFQNEMKKEGFCQVKSIFNRCLPTSVYIVSALYSKPYTVYDILLGSFVRNRLNNQVIDQ